MKSTTKSAAKTAAKSAQKYVALLIKQSGFTKSEESLN